MLLDPVGMVPHSQRWIEYWDRPFYLYITGQDRNAIRQATADVFHAVMQYEDNPASLVVSIPPSADDLP